MIAKRTQRYDFPDKKSVDASYTHNLKDLTKVANLELARLEKANADPLFRNNWDLVQQWSEHSRYRRQEFELVKALCKRLETENTE